MLPASVPNSTKNPLNFIAFIKFISNTSLSVLNHPLKALIFHHIKKTSQKPTSNSSIWIQVDIHHKSKLTLRQCKTEIVQKHRRTSKPNTEQATYHLRSAITVSTRAHNTQLLLRLVFLCVFPRRYEITSAYLGRFDSIPSDADSEDTRRWWISATPQLRSPRVMDPLLYSPFGCWKKKIPNACSELRIA